ncbi:MAG: hypothetical protein AAF063_27595 [Cyanobacteria bacterium J06643_5]
MAINNPLSKTHFKVTKDRLQHYSNDKYTCSDCGHRYYPKVHSQPYIVQFGSILIGVVIFIMFKTQAPPWLYAMLPLLLGGYMIWYYNKDRRVTTPNRTKKIRYGDIVLSCPECRSTRATKTNQL